MLRMVQKFVVAVAAASLCADSSMPAVEGLKLRSPIGNGNSPASSAELKEASESARVAKAKEQLEKFITHFRDHSQNSYLSDHAKGPWRVAQALELPKELVRQGFDFSSDNIEYNEEGEWTSPIVRPENGLVPMHLHLKLAKAFREEFFRRMLKNPGSDADLGNFYKQVELEANRQNVDPEGSEMRAKVRKQIASWLAKYDTE